MNNRRIDFMLRSDPFTRSVWNGFLAPDVILKAETPIPEPKFYIINTDVSSGPGEHWLPLFVFSDCCEVFDSFGFSPDFYGLTQTVFNQCRVVYYNKDQYQSFESKTCGHHALFYAMHRARGFGPLEIKAMYDTHDLKKNDEMVYDYIFARFGRYMAHIQKI